MIGLIIVIGAWTILRIVYWTSYVNCCILFTPKQICDYFNVKNKKPHIKKYLMTEYDLPPATAAIQWAIDEWHDEMKLPLDKRIAKITTGNDFGWFVWLTFVVFGCLLLLGWILKSYFGFGTQF